VQFHWDREGKRDENSSCWVRVSHPWAGKGWGAVAIPRIGQEVVIEFLEGDPDRPIITGRVYNAEAMPPYGLPAAGVISGIKSDSTKGGGGYNEYVMDDTKGNELIREHAQFNKDITVQNNRTATIKSGDDRLTVETGTRSVNVKGNSSHTVQAGHRNITVTGGDYRVEVTNAKVKIIGNTGVDIEGTSTSGVYIHGSPKIKLECGASTIEIDAEKIAMKSGSGQLILNAAGATLIGAIVKIN
jgi:type VI secretion system secreted protein VgrG